MNLKSHPPLFIDTCAINQDFLRWLKRYNGQKNISLIAYMEYCVFCLDQGKDFDHVDQILHLAGISISQFKIENAKTAASIINSVDLEERRCIHCKNVNWNDCMITADTPCAPCILVTDNVKDFEILIDWKDRLKTPKELMYSLDY